MDQWNIARRSCRRRNHSRFCHCAHRNRINSGSDSQVNRMDAADSLCTICGLWILWSKHAGVVVSSPWIELATNFSKNVFAVGHDVRVRNRTAGNAQIRFSVCAIWNGAGTDGRNWIHHQIRSANFSQQFWRSSQSRSG